MNPAGVVRPMPGLYWYAHKLFTAIHPVTSLDQSVRPAIPGASPPARLKYRLMCVLKKSRDRAEGIGMCLWESVCSGCCCLTSRCDDKWVEPNNGAADASISLSVCVWWEGGGATLLTPSVIYSFFITHIFISSSFSFTLCTCCNVLRKHTHTLCIRVWGSADRSWSVCTLSLPRALSTKNGKGVDGRHSAKEPITGLCASVCVSEQTVLASNSAGLR